MPEADAGAGATRVGVVGLGRMGGAMAARLLAAGLDAGGYDVDADALARFARHGGRPADSPRAAAAGASILVVVVHDERQVDEVLFGPVGALGALRPGAVTWLASTVSPRYAAALDLRLREAGFALLDGPVSGGMEAAEHGTLTAIAGATPEALQAAAVALQACVAQLHHVGPAGAGSAVKMINQLLVAVHSALTCEAMVLASAVGLDRARLVDVIGHSAGNSRIFEKRAPRIAAGDHRVQVSIATLHKDLRIALDAAGSLSIELPLAQAAFGLLDRAVRAGRGHESDTTLLA